MAAPAWSPLTLTTRAKLCAASLDIKKSPFPERSNGVPTSANSSTCSFAADVTNVAISASTIPSPAITVSFACASGVSCSSIAAATPPWAHALEASNPNGFGEIIVTGLGARLSAAYNPAKPAPIIRTLCCFSFTALFQINHSLNRQPCFCSQFFSNDNFFVSSVQ